MATSGITSFMSRLHSDDAGKLVLRLAVGGLMLFHGVFKLRHGVAGMADMIEGKGLPGFIAYGAYVGEVAAPILILIGLFTRPAGLLVSFTMVMAIYLVHLKDVGTLTDAGAWGVELQMFYLLGGVAIFFLGAGRFSVSKGRGAWD